MNRWGAKRVLKKRPRNGLDKGPGTWRHMIFRFGSCEVWGKSETCPAADTTEEATTGITPASMEPGEDPLEELTKSRSAAEAVGMMEPFAEATRAGWLTGPEKRIASMDDVSPEGPPATTSKPSSMPLDVESYAWVDPSSVVDMHGLEAGLVHDVHGTVAGPDRTNASSSNIGSSAQERHDNGPRGHNQSSSTIAQSDPLAPPIDAQLLGCPIAKQRVALRSCASSTF
jgi:hypothetical protein